MKTIQDLINQLKSLSYLDKESAAKELATRGVDATDALPELRRLLADQTDPITIGEFLNALVRIEQNEDALIKEFEGYFLNPKFSLKAAEAVQHKPRLAVHFKLTAETKIWDEFRRNPSYDLGKSLLALEYIWDKSLATVQKFIDENYVNETPGVLLIIGIWAAGDITPGNHLKDSEDVLQKIWTTLETKDDLTIINYAYWAIEKIKLRPRASAELISRPIDLWKKLYINYLYKGLNLSLKLSDADIENVMENRLLDDSTKVYILFEDFRAVFDIYWASNKEKVLDYIILNLKRGQAELSHTLIKWLQVQYSTIPPRRIDSLIMELDKGPVGEYEPGKESRLDILKKLSQRKAELNSFGEIKNWKDLKGNTEIQDIDYISQYIVRIIEGRKKSGFSLLFDTWIEWLAYENKELVERAMEEINSRDASHIAVSYLVSLLDKDFRDPRIRSLIMFKVVPSKILSYYRNERSLDSEVENEMADWASKLKTDYEEEHDFPAIDMLNNKKKLNEIINWVVTKEATNRQIKAKREISKKLADMSDETLVEFENMQQKESLKKVKEELKKFAVTEITKKLNNEKDTEVRENYARILGNIGGREAVDAIARAVGGEERNRAARQELLSRFYLEPSLKRSEEAAEILNNAVIEAKRTLRLLQINNTIIFFVGIALIIGGIVIAINSQSQWTTFAGAISTLGGLGGVLIHLVRTPLDRIQTAMANLVQIETAFTSFIWELNLNGTYIQSQYVAEGILQDSEIAKTVNRIENAMSLAMSLVSVFTHNGDGSKGRLSSISPALTKGGTEVKIKGDHLKGIYSNKKENGIVAIDHEPIDATIKDWSDREVSFIIPEKLDNGNDPKTYKVSLFIDGVETNSLPLKVVPNHNN
jgi:hypothetical protein